MTSKDSRFIIGDTVKRQIIINKNAIASIKQKMGIKEMTKIDDKQYTPEEIFAKILSYIKTCAEEKLSYSVSKAVITVPAYFNNTQRGATKATGRIH